MTVIATGLTASVEQADFDESLRARDDRYALAALTGFGAASARHLFSDQPERALAEIEEPLTEEEAQATIRQMGYFVTKITVYPEHRVLPRQSKQQFAVYAHYTDGTVEDITRRAQYESNDPDIAVVDGAGLVRTLEMSGELSPGTVASRSA